MKTKRRKLSRSTGLDVAGLRELVDDGKMHVQIGVVWKEGASHFELYQENGVVVDVLVDVRIEPSGIPVTARLSGLGGGPACGVWAIPPIGAHVVLGVPRGSLEAGVVILGCLSSEHVPDGLDGTTYVIAVAPGAKVLIHDGSAAEAVSLATKADVQALRDYVDQLRAFIAHQFDPATGHTHKAIVPAQPTNIVISPSHTPPGVAPQPVPQPAGTTVLKAK